MSDFEHLVFESETPIRIYRDGRPFVPEIEDIKQISLWCKNSQNWQITTGPKVNTTAKVTAYMSAVEEN